MQTARMNMLVAQIVEPRISQKRLPLTRTNMNMNRVAERTLTRPKTPVRRSIEEVDVKEAERKMEGA